MKKLAVLILLGSLVGLPACGKKTPTTPPVITGALQVTTDPPGAALFLDGEEKGITPLNVTGLFLGKHELVLSKFYYITWSESLAVTGAGTVAKSYRLYPWGTSEIWGRDRSGWRQDTYFYSPVDSVWSSCNFSFPAREGDTLINDVLVENTVVQVETLVLGQGVTGRTYRWDTLSPGVYANAFYWKYPGTSTWLYIIRGKFWVLAK
jgi:hypothetical protein